MVYNKEFKKKIVKTIFRKIIIYANYIMIITNNCKEIKPILLNTIELFNKFDLNILSAKSQIIKYFKNNKMKFNYLGFIFYYVPIKHIKKGGVLTTNKSITLKKK
jgi:hypothetical protein